MAPKKSHPAHIDMAYPQVNFVKACSENHGEDYYEYMYGSYPGKIESQSHKSSGYGHGVGQRAGKLRYSGNPKAHRIGKR